MDAGSVNGMIFLNGMGLGFDAQVAAENYTEPGEVKKGGKHKYHLAHCQDYPVLQGKKNESDQWPEHV